MGQKTHPYGFRLGIIKPWRSRWFARKDFAELLQEDDLIRKYLRTRLAHAAVADQQWVCPGSAQPGARRR